MDDNQLLWLDTALTDALRQVHKDWNLDDFALDRGNTASWHVGNKTYPGYDDPSLAWWYGTFWHPRRVCTALPLVQQILKDCHGNNPTLRVLDIGAGTSAVAWSFQIAAMQLAKDGGVLPRIEIISTDASSAMLNAGRDMWEAMINNESKRDSDFRSFVSPQFICTEWDAPSLLEIVNQNISWVVSSYLVVHEDEKRLSRFTQSLHQIMTKTSAKLAMISARYKEELFSLILRDLAKLKSDSGKSIYKFEEIDSHSGSGELVKLHQLRKETWKPSFKKPICKMPTISDLDGVQGWICKRNSTSGSYELENQISNSRNRKFFSIRDIEWGPAQQEVLDAKLPIVIEGGAGTGKTILLAQKIHNEIQERKKQSSLLESNRYLVIVWQRHIAFQIYCYICELRDDVPEGMVDGKYKTHYYIGEKNLDKTIPLPSCAEIQVITFTKFMEEVLRRLAGVDVPSINFGEKARAGSLVYKELKSVICGSGRVFSLEDYLKVPRRKMKKLPPNLSRDSLWKDCQELREYLFNHQEEGEYYQSYKNSIYLALRLRLQDLVNNTYGDSDIPKQHCFSRIFIDEAQDFSRQDIRSMGKFLLDHRGLTLALDPRQSTFGDVCFQVPGFPWRLRRFELSASYRLPKRLTWSISTLAKTLGESWAGENLFDDDSEEGLLEGLNEDPETNYFRRLGSRLLVLGRDSVEEALQLLETIHPILPTADFNSSRYAAIFGLKPDCSVIEQLNHPESSWSKRLGSNFKGSIIKAHTKGTVKGDEWSVAIWPAWTQLGFNPRPHELAYTLLTRSTRLTILIVARKNNDGVEMKYAQEILESLRSLRMSSDIAPKNLDPILFWDKKSQDQFSNILK